MTQKQISIPLELLYGKSTWKKLLIKINSTVLMVNWKFKNSFLFKNVFLELKDAVIRGTRPDPLKPEDPPLLKRLIESCLNPSPQQRPSFKQMLVDRVFDKIIVEGLLKKPNDEAAKFWVLAFEYKVNNLITFFFFN